MIDWYSATWRLARTQQGPKPDTAPSHLTAKPASLQHVQNHFRWRTLHFIKNTILFWCRLWYRMSMVLEFTTLVLAFPVSRYTTTNYCKDLNRTLWTLREILIGCIDCKKPPNSSIYFFSGIKTAKHCDAKHSMLLESWKLSFFFQIAEWLIIRNAQEQMALVQLTKYSKGN